MGIFAFALEIFIMKVATKDADSTSEQIMTCIILGMSDVGLVELGSLIW